MAEKIRWLVAIALAIATFTFLADKLGEYRMEKKGSP